MPYIEGKERSSAMTFTLLETETEVLVDLGTPYEKVQIYLEDTLGLMDASTLSIWVTIDSNDVPFFGSHGAAVSFDEDDVQTGALLFIDFGYVQQFKIIASGAAVADQVFTIWGLHRIVETDESIPVLHTIP